MDPEKEKSPPPPEWKYKTNTPLQNHLVTVLRQTIDVVKLELAATRKKIRKMKYGS